VREREINRDETRRGDKLAFNTARESGDFYNFCPVFLFCFSVSNVFLMSMGEERRGDGMAKQGGAGQISTCTSSTPHAAEGDKDDDRASEGRGEV
jgi:hypothetical protein